MESNKPDAAQQCQNKSPASVLRFSTLALIFCLVYFTTGCVTFTDPEESQIYTADTIGELSSSNLIGQSFVSRRPRLDGITIWITSPAGQTSETPGVNSSPIQVTLYSSPKNTHALYSTSVTAPPNGVAVPLFIKIPIQSNQASQSYYLEVSQPDGGIQINGRSEDAYPRGQAFINGNPVDADLAFRLNYDYNLSAFTQDAGSFVQNFWLVLPLLVTLWLPGWLILEYSGLRKRFDPGEQTSIAIALSLAFIPILMLWTTTVKVPWSRGGVIAFSIICILLFLLQNIKFIVHHQQTTADPGQPPTTALAKISANWSLSLPLLLIFFAVLAIRLIMVRDLATPAWVDSVHHALITRFILQNGVYPSSYLPFLAINPTDYHPGFHSIAATFTWLSHLDLARSLLILGQVINALAIFPVYQMAKTLTGNARIGIMASFIVGFLTPMPAYYASWGRYTELAGLLMVPAVIALLNLSPGQSRSQRYTLILLGALLSAGLFMIHYRVVIFLALLFIGYLATTFIPRKAVISPPFSSTFRVSLSMAACAILLALPWLLPTIRITLIPAVSAPVAGTARFFQDFSWAYLTSALGKPALILAGLGILLSLIKLERFSYTFLVWIILMFFVANLDALRLPGAGLINHTSVEIILFIPISILGAYFTEKVLTSWDELMPRFLKLPYEALITAALIIVAFIGSKSLLTIINPVTILSRGSDLVAIQWVNDNIPNQETILINPFSWGYGLYAGNDGGYWLSPLTGRPTLPPPVLYGLSPQRSKINELTQQIIKVNSDPRSLHDLLSSNNIHYIFIGARGGILSPQKFSQSNYFTTLYQANGDWVFRVKP